ncbi:MAG: 6,7-dimethyl-8-ribityllumazine synthase [Bacteroidetes bacterium]|nr:6,7-dimethyl-8-ribityllumazine synthase [Bacteroidota bacterium]
MSSADKNLSHFSFPIPQLPSARVAIVTAEWNTEVTNALRQGAVDLLIEAGLPENQIIQKHVPGSYELIFGSDQLASRSDVDAVIALGCVVQGETRHFDFICDAVAHGIYQVSLKHQKPVIFGVLTTDNQQQALERAGGKHGNKGAEAAYTALRLLEEF